MAQFTPEISRYIDEILIVDNASQDNTVNVACAEAKRIPAKTVVIKNRQNYGYGGSMKIAIRYAIEHQFDYLLVLHGDDQADIADFDTLLKTGHYAQYDAVLGARFHPDSHLQNYSRFRTAGNRGVNWLCGMLASQKIYDLGSGLNLYRVKKLSEFPFASYPDDLTFDPHILVHLLRGKANIIYAPVSWRKADQISTAKIFRQGFTILRLFALKNNVIANKGNEPISYVFDIAYP